ncbi:MAG TPA: hypothetical protein VN493_31520 [Thermoanaerobaculia bacterium]|nr:hypothetical protein [Thermoanaerobaculia bacterium]
MNAKTIGTLGLILMFLAGCAGGGTRPSPPDRRPYPQWIDEDLREAARRFIDGRLTGQQYLALVRDRSGKVRRFLDDAAWRTEVAALKDRDGDRVPDSRDDCRTPLLQPTDERGCPMPPDCAPGTPGCAGPTPERDRKTRNLLDEATLLFDPGCDDSPVPQTPEPLEWGRGDQTPAHTTGFNLAVTKVTNQTPECELFYEMEFRLERQAPHVVRHLTILFKATEDLKPGDPRRAVFGLPLGQPLPPARTHLRDGLLLYLKVQWRVRAVNGAQKASPWSALRVQDDPASGGVDG